MNTQNIVFYTYLPEIKYHKPRSVNELLELLDKYGSDARIYAGGTDLLIDLRLRIKKTKHLIDIKGISDLRKIEVSDNGIKIGAAVTLSELEDNGIIKKYYPIIRDSIKKIADHHIRSRATLVGNICNASPAADTAPPLLVYNAYVETMSINGIRKIKLKDFFKGVKKTALKPNEFVSAIEIPYPPENHVGEYFKVGRTTEDISIVGIAIMASDIGDPYNRIIRLAYASVAPIPIIIDEIEDHFRKDKPLDKLIKEAINIVMKKVSPITDIRATREYRLHVVKYATKLLLKKYLEGG